MKVFIGEGVYREKQWNLVVQPVHKAVGAVLRKRKFTFHPKSKKLFRKTRWKLDDVVCQWVKRGGPLIPPTNRSSLADGGGKEMMEKKRGDKFYLRKDEGFQKTWCQCSQISGKSRDGARKGECCETELVSEMKRPQEREKEGPLSQLGKRV